MLRVLLVLRLVYGWFLVGGVWKKKVWSDQGLRIESVVVWQVQKREGGN
jgi:hypothetical protein